MKIYDDVKVIKIKDEYSKEGIKLGDVGTIILPEIRDNCFYVNFIDKNFYTHKNDVKWFEENEESLKDDINLAIEIEDLKLVKEGNATDEMILQELPKNNPKWWCKVENGYIMNLLGEKKNKIPYDYKS